MDATAKMKFTMKFKVEAEVCEHDAVTPLRTLRRSLADFQDTHTMTFDVGHQSLIPDTRNMGSLSSMVALLMERTHIPN